MKTGLAHAGQRNLQLKLLFRRVALLLLLALSLSAPLEWGPLSTRAQTPAPVASFEWRSSATGPNTFDEAIITASVYDASDQWQIVAQATLGGGSDDDDYVYRPYVSAGGVRNYIFDGKAGNPNRADSARAEVAVPVQATFLISKSVAAIRLGYENYFDRSHPAETLGGGEESGDFKLGGDPSPAPSQKVIPASDQRFRYVGLWDITSAGARSIFTSARIEFEIEATSLLKLRFNALGAPADKAAQIKVQIDDAPLPDLGIPVSGEITVSTSLSPARHRIVIWQRNNPSVSFIPDRWSNGGGLIFTAAVISGAGTLLAPSWPRPDFEIQFIGDSRIEGDLVYNSSLSQNRMDGTVTFAIGTGDILNLQPVSIGVSGQTLVNVRAGVPPPPQEWPFKFKNHPRQFPSARAVVILYGHNDRNNNLSPATFKANLQALVDAIRKNYSTVPIFILRDFSNSFYLTEKQAVVSANKNCYYVDTSGWLLSGNAGDYTDYTRTDGGVHPSRAGHSRAAQLLAQVIADVIYSGSPSISNINPRSGPTSGRTHVWIKGTDFTSGASVFFGSQRATGIVLLSSTELICVAPASSADAPVDVRVNTSKGAYTVAQGFKYTASGTDFIDMGYTNRAALINDGWSFNAVTASGKIRATEDAAEPVQFSASSHPGRLRIPVQEGSLELSDNNSRNTLFRDLPSDWTSIRMKVNAFDPGARTQAIGLAVYQDDDHYIGVMRYFSYDQRLRFEYESGSAHSSISIKTDFRISSNFALRLDRSPATQTYTAYYSIDGGVSYTKMSGTCAQTISKPKLAIVSGYNPAGAPSPRADIEWVEIVAPSLR